MTTSRTTLPASLVTMLKDAAAEGGDVTVNPVRVQVTAEVSAAAEAAVIVKTPEAKLIGADVDWVKPWQPTTEGCVPDAVNETAENPDTETLSAAVLDFPVNLKMTRVAVDTTLLESVTAPIA